MFGTFHRINRLIVIFITIIATKSVPASNIDLFIIYIRAKIRFFDASKAKLKIRVFRENVQYNMIFIAKHYEIIKFILYLC